MSFIQIIEYKTSRIDEVREVVEKHRANMEGSMAVRGTATQDRDRPNTYLNIVEFESWEKAQENSNKPETSAFAQDMMALCDGPPTFYNLDVIETF
jgi:quinol monooxygenase YgiN